MKIEAKVFLIKDKEPLKANVSFTVDGWLALRDCILRDGHRGPFLSFPARKYVTKEGAEEYSDYYFPVTREKRDEMFKIAWAEYEKALATV